MFFTETQKGFLDNFAGALHVAEDPAGVSDQVTFMSLQRGHDPFLMASRCRAPRLRTSRCRAPRLRASRYRARAARGFRRVFHPSLVSINVRHRRLLDMQDKNLVPWLEALERRHLAHLTFSEVRRA